MTGFTNPALADIRAAAARIAMHARVTPVLCSDVLDEIAGARLFFKGEHLQRGGAFKFRGACNAVWSLTDDEARRGVVTHSSGNHGAALALAARTRGIPAHIVVPEGAVAAKLANIERAGGILHRCAPTQAAREEACARVQRETGATLVHPYADARVMAGQGTIALELLQQVPDLDAVITPIGGGGLISGCAIALRALAPGVEVVGAEPAGADDALQSLRRGERVTDIVPHTVCDGLRATIGAPNLALLRELQVDVIAIDDDAVLVAMRLLWAELKQTVEPSSAIVLAALLAQRERFAGRRIGLVLSGGNVDLDAIPFRSSAR
ncbi:MAG: pyridoxal-phosphate dependent enzyme [Xanthomonadales bacterium]|nr:pyridoxal-phosphate dependent enzyme [Xanthomonadales bacterium]ODU93263.1 MAG: serine dehydratase [Rhodanobacter sp. SCN 66-43]OJY82166.1 MAG: serine dehydratase [Xanthomonadales bacterium 66-474]